MSQTSKIFGVLLIGFLVYITAKGQLSQYLGLFGIGAASTSAVSPTGA